MAQLGIFGLILLFIIPMLAALMTAKKRKEEMHRLEASIPSLRDGYLVSALSIELVDQNGKEWKGAPWLIELFSALDEVVTSYEVKPVGHFQSTYMALSTSEKVALDGLVRLTECSVAIRDAVREFGDEHRITILPKFGIHSDVVPSLGMGSTVALSQIWNRSLDLSDRSLPNVITLSPQSTEWLGDSFDLSKLSLKPALNPSF
jgi:hypothetical protein